ncbi:hypothetical protein [Nocardia terpenica]|uniref:Uncharacterized protein n=1 Tax=Nocardia terpenica TaxID=455432 RepID=A0A291RYC3_9NOCA|nr:hypothetical protein [Nocardia terpenica]ATL72533.1 hypothetical protein CRH09_39885 [Nocardia terpenica]
MTELFVRIDETLVNRINHEMEARCLNKWEVVEEALREGLPKVPTPIADEPALLDVRAHRANLKAS